MWLHNTDTACGFANVFHVPGPCIRFLTTHKKAEKGAAASGHADGPIGPLGESGVKISQSRLARESSRFEVVEEEIHQLAHGACGSIVDRIPSRRRSSDFGVSAINLDGREGANREDQSDT